MCELSVQIPFVGSTNNFTVLFQRGLSIKVRLAQVMCTVYRLMQDHGQSLALTKTVNILWQLTLTWFIVLCNIAPTER